MKKNIGIVLIMLFALSVFYFFNPQITNAARTVRRMIGVYNATPFILSDGEGSALSTDANGNLKVVMADGALRISTTTSAVDYSFQYDIDTGMNWDAVDQIGLYTGGIARLTVNNTGKVGIGTTTPAYKLDVYGDARVDGMLITTNFNGRIIIDGIKYAKTNIGINAAVADCIVLGLTKCSEIFLPAGEYSISDKITLYNGINFIGAGIGGTKLIATAQMTNNGIFSYIGSASNYLNDVRISNMEFDGSAEPLSPVSTARKAIYIQWARRLVIDNIYAHGFPSTCIGPDMILGGIFDTIYVSDCGNPGQNPGHNGLGIGVAGTTTEPLLISNIYAWNNKNNGVLLESIGSIPSYEIKMMNIVSHGNKRGIRLSGASNVSINNCTSYNNTFDGVFVEYYAGDPSENMQISNCQIHGNGDSGIRMPTWDDVNINPIITGNTIYQNGRYGIITGANYASISNNTIWGNGEIGIFYNADKVNIVHRGISIIGNIVYDNATSTIAGYNDGIRVLSNAGTINGLNISNNQVFNTTTGNQNYNIVLKQNTTSTYMDNIIISNNITYGGLTGELLESALSATTTKNYWGNIGIANKIINFNGVTQLTLVGNNLGLQRADPSYLLDIGDATSLSSGLSGAIARISTTSNMTSGIQMSNGSAGTSADFRFLITDTSGHYVVFSQPGTGNTGSLFGLTRSTGDFIFNNGGTARTLMIGNTQVADVAFGTNNTERMRIISNGNVGIGTTTPTTNLQVTTASANATSTLTVGKTGQTKGSCLELFDAVGTAQYISVIDGVLNVSATSCK